MSFSKIAHAAALEKVAAADALEQRDAINEGFELACDELKLDAPRRTKLAKLATVVLSVAKPTEGLAKVAADFTGADTLVNGQLSPEEAAFRKQLEAAQRPAAAAPAAPVKPVVAPKVVVPPGGTPLPAPKPVTPVKPVVAPKPGAPVGAAPAGKVVTAQVAREPDAIDAAAAAGRAQDANNAGRIDEISRRFDTGGNVAELTSKGPAADAADEAAWMDARRNPQPKRPEDVAAYVAGLPKSPPAQAQAAAPALSPETQGANLAKATQSLWQPKAPAQAAPAQMAAKPAAPPPPPPPAAPVAAKAPAAKPVVPPSPAPPVIPGGKA